MTHSSGGQTNVGSVTNGSRVHPHGGRVVSNFIGQARRHEPTTMYGDGTQSHSLCYVDDHTDGVLRLMDTAPAITGPINLGKPNELSITELAETIVALSNAAPELKQEPLPSDDPHLRCPDIGRTRNELRWEPKIEFEQGLQATITCFESQLREGKWR